VYESVKMPTNQENRRILKKKLQRPLRSKHFLSILIRTKKADVRYCEPTSNPYTETLRFLKAKHLLKIVFESEVEGLRGEVSKDVGPISPPDCPKIRIHLI
jgi:hypothetical protein